MNDLISAISFDMGAINTGIVHAQYLSGEKDIDHVDISSDLVRLNPGDLTLGYKKRTQKRHQVRGYKRRKMAKRLLWVILKKAYGLESVLEKTDPTVIGPFVDSVNGLLNRRGFTYLTEDFGGDDLTVSTPELVELGFTFLIPDKKVEEQYPELAKNSESFLRSPVFSKDYFKLNKKRLEDLGFTKDDFTENCKALKEILNALARDAGGHKKRKEYLSDIHSDINVFWNSSFPLLNQTSLTPDHFYSLVGHISNLQLRCLRKYFNVESWKTGDQWDEGRLFEKFHRYVISWHAKTESERASRSALLEALKQNQQKKSVLNVWLTVDPVNSIPPYEDQNDRHPPKCSTLLLDPEILDQKYPGWKSWIQKADAGGFLDSFTFSRLPADSPEFLARQLQFIFDRTGRSDAISLRSILSDKPPKDMDEQKSILFARLGNDMDLFLSCAKRYYTETNIAAEGGWYPELPGRILRECRKNPPHKNKMAHLILGHLLGLPLTLEDVDALYDFLKNTKCGRKKLIRIGADLTTIKKKLGASFKVEYEDILSECPPEESEKSKKKVKKIKAVPGGHDKDLQNLVLNYLPDASNLLFDYLQDVSKRSEDSKDILNPSRYRDPFVWSQLYDILEGDVSGFSHTCRECSEDNRCRSAHFKMDELGNPIAYAKRLPNNTDKPFDGMVARLASRIALEAAKKKADLIVRWIETLPGTSPLHVQVPIIVEENKFEFAMDLLELRAKENYSVKADKKKALQGGLEVAQNRWKSKDERIKGDSLGVCPYCGNPIGENEQIDHILPRAFSIAHYGTVFNSEPNLIYCHTACNCKKGNKPYTLENLSPDYLVKQFGTRDAQEIKHYLENEFYSIRRIFPRYASAFATMNDEQRKVVRHLLFLDAKNPARTELSKELRQLNKTNVNGTQRWLVRKFAEALRNELKKRECPAELEITAYKVVAEDTNHTRKFLVGEDSSSDLAKPDDQQAAYSHIIDAAMVMGNWARNHGYWLPEQWEDEEFLRNWLKKLLPDSYTISSAKREKSYRKRDFASQQIFKDTIYSDKFFSLVMTSDGSLKFGFSPKNADSVKPKKVEEVYRLIRPFLRQDRRVLPEDYKELQKMVIQLHTPLICPIDQKKAREFLHQIAKTNVTDKSAWVQADLLDALHYSTVKKPVQDYFQTQGKMVEKKNLLDKLKRDTAVKIDHFYFEKTQFVLPASSAWEKIIQDPMFSNLWGTKVPDNNPVWKEMEKRFFMLPDAGEERTTKHKKVRKIFSLPLVQNPSGGFRIRRRTADGAPVWQVLATNSAAYCGFKSDKGTADFRYPVVLKGLQSDHVHGLGGRYAETDDVAFMDEWREVELLDREKELLLHLSLAPGSASRMNARIVAKHELITRLLGEDHKNIFTNTFASIPLKDENWKKVPDLAILKPRLPGSVSVRSVTKELIEIEYVLTGSPSELKDRYNRGKPLPN